MNLFIDGKAVEVSYSRNSSQWYTHPIRNTMCMCVKRSFTIGFQTKHGKISRCNQIQKQFLYELHAEKVSVRIQYKDAGYLHKSTDTVARFTFIFEERDPQWGEQRLQEMLDKVLALQVKPE